MPGYETKEHMLKTWPVYFSEVLNGRKTFEVRRADRDFRVGDTLALMEWCPEKDKPLGRYCRVNISYILGDSFDGVADGWVVLGFKYMGKRSTSQEVRDD